MALGVNYVAAAILALAIGFYVFIYDLAQTPDAAEHRDWRCCRSVSADDRLGGVTGDVSLGGIALFALIFLWTPPHFWALALYGGDTAGVPMLPVVSGVMETKRQILLYTLLLMPVSLVPWWIGTASIVWNSPPLWGFCLLRWRCGCGSATAAPRWMFRYSLLYLSVLFAA